MKNFRNVLFAAVALAGMSVGISSASAETITFTTSGLFTSGGNGLASGSSITYSSGGSASTTLTFDADTSPVTVSTPKAQSLGDFEITTVDGGVIPTNGSSFTLTIDQTIPAGSPGHSGGAITDEFTGVIVSNSSGGFDITLSPTTIGISGVSYSLQDLNGIDQLSVSSGTNINANITSVPLPAAAWGGMGLLGLLGAAKARSRRQNI